MDLTNDELIKLKKREYYKKYRETNRYKIRETSRNFYHKQITNNSLNRKHINEKTLINRHKKILNDGKPIRPRGRPLKTE